MIFYKRREAYNRFVMSGTELESMWIKSLEEYSLYSSFFEETNCNERFQNEWKKLAGFKFDVNYFLSKSYRHINDLKTDLRLINYFGIKMDSRYSLLIIEIILNCEKDEELDDLFVDYILINDINVDLILKLKKAKRVKDSSIDYLFYNLCSKKSFI